MSRRVARITFADHAFRLAGQFHDHSSPDRPHSGYQSAGLHSRAYSEVYYDNPRYSTNAGPEPGSATHYNGTEGPGAGPVGFAERPPFEEHSLFGDMGSLSHSGQMVIKDIEQPNVKVPRQLTNNVQHITDDWRRKYAIFPRSCNMSSPTRPYASPNQPANDDDAPELTGVSASTDASEKTLETLRLFNGYETKMHVPKMTPARRTRERALNELGSRMSWEHGRKFCDEHQEPQVPRMMFLQRSRKWRRRPSPLVRMKLTEMQWEHIDET